MYPFTKNKLEKKTVCIGQRGQLYWLTPPLPYAQSPYVANSQLVTKKWLLSDNQRQIKCFQIFPRFNNRVSGAIFPRFSLFFSEPFGTRLKAEYQPTPTSSPGSFRFPIWRRQENEKTLGTKLQLNKHAFFSKWRLRKDLQNWVWLQMVTKVSCYKTSVLACAHFLSKRSNICCVVCG